MKTKTEVRAEAPAPAAARPSVTMWAVLLVFSLVVAVIGYSQTGMPDYDTVAAQATPRHPDVAGMDQSMHLESLVEKLTERLKTQPDDLKGWVMLGRARAFQGKPAEAVAAFAKAASIKPDDPDVLADWAESLAMKDGSGLAGEPMRLIERALATDPKHPKALALSGAAAYDRKDYATAVRQWETLVAVSPPDADYLEQVRAGIADARQQGKLPGGPAVAAAAQAVPAAPAAQAKPAAAGPTAAAGGASLSGTITLAPGLAAQAKPDDTVFVFARAAEGSRMPLVIQRHQVKDLPLKFTLDDSQAMQGAQKLSALPQLVVVARVSRSGQAAAQPGDLTGQSAPVAPGAQGLRVEISEVFGKP